jgi:hypothetical protein
MNCGAPALAKAARTVGAPDRRLNDYPPSSDSHGSTVMML